MSRARRSAASREASPDPVRASAPSPERWADLRRAAEARAQRATGERPARGVTFAPGSGSIRA